MDLMNSTRGERFLSTEPNQTSGGSSSYADHILSYLDLYLKLIIIPIFSLVPIVTNIINMAVFYKQGLTSCVNLCLFFLSAADLLCLITAAGTITATFLMYFNLRPGFDPNALYFIMAYAGSTTYDIANTLTAFLSLERCLCVVLPLKFKDIITFRRGACAIVFIYLGMIALWIPHYLSFRVTYLQDGVNSTRYLGLELFPNRANVDLYLDSIILLGLTPFNLIVVCICTQAMMISLRRSSKFQEQQDTHIAISSESREFQLSVKNSKTNYEDSHRRIGGQERGLETININDAFQNSLNNSSPDLKDQSLKNKSLKTIKQTESAKTKSASTASRNQNMMKIVITLCIIFFICNLVRLPITVIRKTIPQFNFGSTLEHWFQLAITLVFAFQIANCSLNIVVYYRYNRSFRDTLQGMFCGWRKKLTENVFSPQP